MRIRLYDAHAHLADERLRPSIESILAECRRRRVCGIAAAAARRAEWDEIERLSANEDIVFGALGVHPFFPDDWNDACAGELRRRAASPAIHAIGEIGLDFWNGRERLAEQRDMLAAQIEIACELRKPVVIHNRKSWEEFLAVWRATASGRIAGVCHHFTGSREILRRVLDAGLYVSFCGPVTYPNARRIREAAAYAPADRILTETDAPDLPPAARRGEQSRPWHVLDVLETLSALRGVSIHVLAEQVRENFEAVFGRKTAPVPGNPAGGSENAG